MDEALDVDEQAIKAYFPMDHVLSEIIKIYSELLHLDIRRVEAEGATWHVDVELYEVRDAGSGAVEGHFYLDLFPRPGKYGHQCVWC